MFRWIEAVSMVGLTLFDGIVIAEGMLATLALFVVLETSRKGAGRRGMVGESIGIILVVIIGLILHSFLDHIIIGY